MSAWPSSMLTSNACRLLEKSVTPGSVQKGLICLNLACLCQNFPKHCSPTLSPNDLH